MGPVTLGATQSPERDNGEVFALRVDQRRNGDPAEFRVSGWRNVRNRVQAGPRSAPIGAPGKQPTPQKDQWLPFCSRWVRFGVHPQLWRQYIPKLAQRFDGLGG